MLDHAIFNERPESQDRAIDQLRSMGYVYVSPAEAENTAEVYRTLGVDCRVSK